MLTPLDDSLWHQISTTFDHVGTSDPRFFDRYWFAINAPDGRTTMQLTLGAYRNMNVVDAGVAVVRDGMQHNVRASRSLDGKLSAECGPIRIEVVEPLHEFRLCIADPDASVRGEIRWRAITAPQEDQPHFERYRSRLREDYRRFNQIGVADGWLQIDGIDVEVSDWWSCRDHSWGVRPGVGVREPVTGPPQRLEHDGFVMAFLFFSTDSHAGHLLTNARGNEAPYSTGVIMSRDGGDNMTVGDLDLGVQLVSGTRRFQTAQLTASTTGGEQVVFTTSAHGSAVAMKGLGYSGGYRDGAGLGVWRGELHVEQDVWDVSHPAEVIDEQGRSKAQWHRIQPVRITSDLGDGFGSLTLILSGRLPRFGLS